MKILCLILKNLIGLIIEKPKVVSNIKDIVENIPVSWCHGAPGILISRLELYKNNTLNVEFRRTMNLIMDVAIDTTIKIWFWKKPLSMPWRLKEI